MAEKAKLPFQFIKSMYFKPRFARDDRNKSYMAAPDYLVLVYRDERDNKKKLRVIEEPTIKFYVAKEEVEVKHPLNYIPADLVDIMKCKFHDLPRQLARLADMEDDYYETLKKSPYQARMKYHQLPFVFGSDMDIEDYYKGVFLDMYAPKKNKVTKGFYDIEVDIKGYPSFPDQHEAPCPINIITYLDADTKTSYTFVLRNKKNPLIKKMEDNIEKFKKKLKKKINPDFDYDIRFYDYELDLITAFYQVVNECQPDFNLAWNANFDKLTLINRIDKLGGDLREIMCHPDFPEDVWNVYFNEDTRNQKYSDKSETFECSSYTEWIDQLILYASLRKGLGERESYALGAVAREELNDDKLDYSEASDLAELPYTDFELFSLYNIKDVFLLYELEKKNEDVEMLFSIAEMTRTRLNKAMRKTVSLKNMAFKFYKDQGYIMGNNHNVRIGDDDKDKEPTEKFEGAVVADPNLNDHMGMELNGRLSMYVFQKVIDFDLAALYPSIIRAFNIDGSTQYGRLLIGDEPPTKEYDAGGEFTDHLEAQNWIELGKKWFNLPSTEDLIKELEEAS